MRRVLEPLTKWAEISCWRMCLKSLGTWDTRFGTRHIIHASSSTHLPASKTVMKTSTNYLHIGSIWIILYIIYLNNVNFRETKIVTENWCLEGIFDLMGSSQLLVRWHHCPPGRVHAKLRRGHRDGDDSPRMRGGLILHWSKMTHWWRRNKPKVGHL